MYGTVSGIGDILVVIRRIFGIGSWVIVYVPYTLVTLVAWAIISFRARRLVTCVTRKQRWTRADFEWDAENDQYVCPEGHALKQFRRNYSDSGVNSCQPGRLRSGSTDGPLLALPISRGELHPGFRAGTGGRDSTSAGKRALSPIDAFVCAFQIWLKMRRMV